MPSEKVLGEKQQIVADLSAQMSSSMAGVIVDYKGITVEQDTKLRTELRNAGIRYSVEKNTLLRFAVKGTSLEDLTGVFEGTTALATSDNDMVVAAKILSKYAADSKGKFSIKAGFVEGSVIDAAGVESLAKLPAKEVLIAQVLGGFNAPISGLANVLNGNIRGLAVALNAIAQQKSA